VRGVVIRGIGKEEQLRAPMTVDATGRSRVLARMLERDAGKKTVTRRRPMVAFKAHFTNTRIAPGACEIYFYSGGYGGLSSIENGLSNLCFIVNSRDARALQSDPDRVVREVVNRNRRAAETLANAQRETDWLAVSLDGFGRHSPAPANGLWTIGDAASFIDPFTGSGMLMAMESGELAANTIAPQLGSLDQPHAVAEITDRYRASYQQRFNSRLRLCSLIRRAAFVPGLAEMAVRTFGLSDVLRRRFARATRSTNERNLSSAHSFK
jgi:flavin-dependent dehydrogenase